MDHFYKSIEGWNDFRQIFVEAIRGISKKKATFVEIGSWKGRSAACMAVEIINHGKNFNFYAVDTWDGEDGENRHYDADTDVVGGTLYETFLRNIEPVKDWIKPIRAPSVEAAGVFYPESVDFIFLDGTHTYEAVKADLAAWVPNLKVGGVIAGDDLHWDGVEKAIREVFGSDFEKLNGGKQWRAVKRTSTRPVDSDVFYDNSEGLAEWNISREFWKGRRPGISAMMRIKNEGQFLEYAVDSIADWHEEICLFPQGEQTDNTLEVCEKLKAKYRGKVVVYPYPFESVQNGPYHDYQKRGSVHERAYFYNWCLSKTTCEFADKWDGDMIAHDDLGSVVLDLIKHKDGIYFAGTDLAGDLRFESQSRNTASELRVFRVSPSSFYYTSTHCEDFAPSSLDRHRMGNIEKLKGHRFVHLKWCKDDIMKSTVGWPEDWAENHVYYRDLVMRKQAGKPYLGPWPKAIQPYMEARG